MIKYKKHKWIKKSYLSGHWDLVFRPDAGQVDTDAGHDGGRVPQAHCGQVQRVRRHEVRSLGQLLRR